MYQRQLASEHPLIDLGAEEIKHRLRVNTAEVLYREALRENAARYEDEIKTLDQRTSAGAQEAAAVRNSFLEQIEAYQRQVQLTTPQEARNNLEITLAIERAVETRQAVALPLAG